MNYKDWNIKFRQENRCSPLLSEAYEAGQQDKQKEFDDLQKMYDVAIQCLMESNYGDEKYLRTRGAIK